MFTVVGLMWVFGTALGLTLLVVFTERVDSAPRKIGWISRVVSGFRESPLPYLAIGVSALSLFAGTTSAIFAGLNYFKTPRSRATLVLDRFDDNVIQLLGVDRRIHQLRIWLSNSGQSPARVRQVRLHADIFRFLMRKKLNA